MTEPIPSPLRPADLTGKTAVITGAGSGIGRALATQLAARGANLVLADIEEAALDATVEFLAGSAGDVAGLVTDVARAEDLDALAEHTFDRHGRVDLLVNNAGVAVTKRCWEYAIRDWQWVFGVNVWGVVNGINAFVPRMLTQDGTGWVVNTASIAGVLPFARAAAYSASKAAVLALAESLWHDLREVGAAIGTSVVCPGLVATRFSASARNRPGQEGYSPATAVAASVGIDPAEVARIVLDGVAAGQFWLFTHGDPYDALTVERAQSMVRGGLPVPPPWA